MTVTINSNSNYRWRMRSDIWGTPFCVDRKGCNTGVQFILQTVLHLRGIYKQDFWFAPGEPRTNKKETDCRFVTSIEVEYSSDRTCALDLIKAPRLVHKGSGGLRDRVHWGHGYLEPLYVIRTAIVSTVPRLLDREVPRGPITDTSRVSIKYTNILVKSPRL